MPVGNGGRGLGGEGLPYKKGGDARCTSYGVKILGFGTTLGVQSKILTFAYNTVPFRGATVN